MSGLLQSELQADLATITADLADSGIIQTVTIYQADGETERAADVTILSNSSLSATEIRDQGWETKYSHSIHTDYASTSTVVQDDIVVLSTGRFRVLAVKEGPALVWMRLDLSSEWQDSQ